MLAGHQEQITLMVEVIQYHGLTQQEQSALNGEFGESKKWAAFFDVDEFLVLKKHEHVDEIFEEHLTKDSGALIGLVCNVKPVTKRFLYQCQDVNQHIKSIR
jgi:hypothetical protein